MVELHKNIDDRNPYLNCPKCFGRKKCPMVNRSYCSKYYPCLEEFILRKLSLSWSPTAIRKEIKEIEPCLPDWIILKHIGEVAVRNLIVFGVKKVNRAIKESSISDDEESDYYSQCVRKAFGVYGREGRDYAKKVAIGNTGDSQLNGDAFSEG